MVCDFVLASFLREYKILNLVKSLKLVSWIFFNKNRKWKKKGENYIYSTALDKFGWWVLINLIDKISYYGIRDLVQTLTILKTN